MILWNYSFPSVSEMNYSVESFAVCSRGLKADFLHADPYRLGSLSWNFIGLAYGREKWGAFAQARLYGLDGLYDNTEFATGAALKLSPHMAGSIFTKFAFESFEGFGEYRSLDLGVQATFKKGNLGATTALNGIKLLRPYADKQARLEPMFIGSYSTAGHMVLSAGFRKSSQQRNRFMANHDIRLTPAIGLNLGYMNNPNVLRWGLDFSWKKVRLMVTYIGMDKLNDTIVLGVSAGSI